MKAIILAAGEAKRLWPITKSSPKCLLKIGGSAIIDHQIESLKKNGIRQAVVVVGFKSEKIINHLTGKYPGFIFDFIENKEYKSTLPAYGLWLAKEYLKKTVLYLNADVLYNVNIITKVVKSQKDSATAVQRVPWDEEEVKVVVGKDMAIKAIGKQINEKESYGEFIGVTKLGKEFNQKLIKILDRFTENNERQKFAADAINEAINQEGGKIHALDVTAWPATEIDTAADYQHAKDIWKELK